MGAAAETDQLQCQKQTTAAEPADKEPVFLKHFVHPANASAATVIAEVKKKTEFREKKERKAVLEEERKHTHTF